MITPADVKCRAIALAMSRLKRTESGGRLEAGLRGLAIAEDLESAKDFQHCIGDRHDWENNTQCNGVWDEKDCETYREHRLCTQQIEWVYERYKLAIGAPGPYDQQAVEDVRAIMVGEIV